MHTFSATHENTELGACGHSTIARADSFTITFTLTSGFIFGDPVSPDRFSLGPGIFSTDGQCIICSIFKGEVGLPRYDGLLGVATTPATPPITGLNSWAPLGIDDPATAECTPDNFPWTYPDCSHMNYHGSAQFDRAANLFSAQMCYWDASCLLMNNDLTYSAIAFGDLGEFGTYSFAKVAEVPEPSGFLLLATAVLTALICGRSRRVA